MDGSRLGGRDDTEFGSAVSGYAALTEAR